MRAFKYRPDVDGLRAVAVILVLLFHTGLGFSGGYIGVDIFFVISGFLITGLILKEQDAGTFSLANFWARRVRRIVPAATVVVAAVLVVGFFVLWPDDYAALGKSALAQQLMLSNIYFWRNTGYFDGAAEVKPLLHTWSLGVEEQFYLGYPFLLVLLYRFGQRVTIVSLSLLFATSFIVSEYGARHHPSATFYLLPTRAWELLLGGLICFLPKPTQIRPGLLMACSWLSFGAIFGSGWFYNLSTRFPGLSALIPCAATGGLIYFNSIRHHSPASALAAKPVVFIGKISYSLYLWHWPILAFYRYWNDTTLSITEAILLLAFTSIAAFLSWRFIEVPFRRGTGVVSRKSVFVLAGAVLSFVLICSGIIVLGQGFAWRVPTKALHFEKFSRSHQFMINVAIDQVERGELPRLGTRQSAITCVLWGDSHAMAVASGLNAACEELKIVASQATYSSTPPILDFVQNEKYGLGEETPAFNSAVLDFIRKKKVRVVFLAGFWTAYAGHDVFETNMKKTVDAITSTGARVVVILDVAMHEVDVPRHFAKNAFLRRSQSYAGVPDAQHRDRNEKAERLIRAACDGNSRAFVLDPVSMLVDSHRIWRAEIDGQLMYRDHDHLSVEGGLRLKPLFYEFIRSVEFEK